MPARQSQNCYKSFPYLCISNSKHASQTFTQHNKINTTVNLMDVNNKTVEFVREVDATLMEIKDKCNGCKLHLVLTQCSNTHPSSSSICS